MTEVTEQRSGLESQSKAEHQEMRFERIKCNHMVAQIQGEGDTRGEWKRFRYGMKAVVHLWNRDHDNSDQAERHKQKKQQREE